MRRTLAWMAAMLAWLWGGAYLAFPLDVEHWTIVPLMFTYVGGLVALTVLTVLAFVDGK